MMDNELHLVLVDYDEPFPVTEFSVSPCVLFRCLFCNGWIESKQHGPYHHATSDHCRGCKMRYTVHWDNGQPTITMCKSKSEKVVN